MFNRLSESYIKRGLKGTPYNVTIKKKVSSTNALMKEFALKGGEKYSVLIAEEQTEGRGRMGRSFYSPEQSGIYMSILLRPRAEENSLLITTDAAVSCALAFEKLTGCESEIKWVNDIYIAGRKVCGILTESGENYAVLGIGVNVYPPSDGFPEEIRNRAGALFNKKSKRIREKTIIALLKEFLFVYKDVEKSACFCEYKKRSLVIGKEVEIINNNTIEAATVLDLNPDYSLHIRKQNGEEEKLFTGDISIKI